MYKLYFGIYNEDPSVIKVGRTKQNCYKRCQCSDFTIYHAVRFKKRIWKKTYSILEKNMKIFYELYHPYSKKFKGNEYFKTNKDLNNFKDFFEEVKRWEDIVRIICKDRHLIEGKDYEFYKIPEEDFKLPIADFE